MSGYKKKGITIALLIGCLGLLGACGKKEEVLISTEDIVILETQYDEKDIASQEEPVMSQEKVEQETENLQMSNDTELKESIEKEVSANMPEVTENVQEHLTEEQKVVQEDPVVLKQLPEPASYVEGTNGLLIAIDAGHQKKGNSKKEPIGPGASQTKAKVSSGTRGKYTGIAEYELTLQLAILLQEELINRGYSVLMVRTTHDVDISNAERAGMANEANADAFIRIHANGADSASAHGAMTICQTSENPYNGALYEKSKALSSNVLDALVASTGCRKERVWETDTMSGINWCMVPVTIVEVGYMTNETEDRLMATADYQNLIIQGIANGIDAYFE